MQQRTLGSHSVGSIGFGAMSLGGTFGAASRDDCMATMDAAWDAGITHFDTANIYGMGLSEALIGEWSASRGHRPVLATKASIIPGPPRAIDNSAAYLTAELEASLRRLGRDHVELFYLHRRQADLPLDLVVGTMARLIEQGKIGGYGLSEVSPATIRAAHALHPVTAVQNEYSLWTRLPELGVIDTCRDLGITCVAFSPLGRGIFGDQPLELPQDGFRSSNPRFMQPNFDANSRAVAAFRAFAQSRGWTTAAAALAWVLQRGDHILPIPGTKSPAHLRDWLAADQIRFTAEDLQQIARLLPAGFAHGDRYSDHQMLGVERYC